MSEEEVDRLFEEHRKQHEEQEKQRENALQKIPVPPVNRKVLAKRIRLELPTEESERIGKLIQSYGSWFDAHLEVLQREQK